jgi:hypothetical protein
MGIPDADNTEIEAGAKAIVREFGSVIGENQARNIAYITLVAARGAKMDERRGKRDER